MNERLWSCHHNEERSPFSTRRQSCSGRLHYGTSEADGLTLKLYICDKHLEDSDSDIKISHTWV